MNDQNPKWYSGRPVGIFIVVLAAAAIGVILYSMSNAPPEERAEASISAGSFPAAEASSETAQESPSADTGETGAPNSEAAEGSVSSDADHSESSRPAEVRPPDAAEPQALPDPPLKPQQDSGIAFERFSLFSGQFAEDGRDQPVENVASLLVTNTTDQFLELATLTFKIDGKPAAFAITGLGPGKSAWVMEAAGLTAAPTSSIEFLECIPSFRSDIQAESSNLSITAEGNLLTVKNISDEKLEAVSVYYKNLHTDGNYFGGITYKADAGDLEPGASAEVLAGHYNESISEIVRVGWRSR